MKIKVGLNFKDEQINKEVIRTRNDSGFNYYYYFQWDYC